MKGKFLIVDDDQAIREKFKEILEDMDLEADFVSTYEDVIPTLKKAPHSYAGLFLDHNLKNKDGKSVESLSLVPTIREYNPYLVLVMISGDKSEDNLTKWLHLNLSKFFYKPIKTAQIKAMCQYSLTKFDKEFGSTSVIESHVLTEEDKKAIDDVGIVAGSKDMAVLCKDVVRLSKTDTSVILIGETGTGKELFAKAVHNNSNRKDKPFLVLNCSSYNSSSELLESELFGHMKGSFTGADKDKIGIFEQANGGTVFLDEIHHLCYEAQAKLLRVLQENKIRRVGDYKERPVDFGLVCAGKPELMDMVKREEFLPDLYYRIFFIDMTIPPLRERTDDIIPLLNHFMKQNENKLKIKKVFTNSAIKALKEYPWPGNVRELESAIKAAYIMNDKRTITAKDLSSRLSSSIQKNSSTDSASQFEELVAKHRNEQTAFILETLNKVSFNTTKAAKELKLPRTSLISKMKSLGLDGLSKDSLQELFRKEKSQPRGVLA